MVADVVHRQKGQIVSKNTKVHQLGAGGWKCDAKLRVIANGETAVNVVRAERCDAISVAPTYNVEQRTYSMEAVEAVEAKRLESADPLGRRVSSNPGFVGDLFATHPPMSIRVARLKAMAFQAEKSGASVLEAPSITSWYTVR